jgi:hypothetical protein
MKNAQIPMPDVGQHAQSSVTWHDLTQSRNFPHFMEPEG